MIAQRWGVTAPFWFAFVGSAVFVVLIWGQLSHIAHDDDLAARDALSRAEDGGMYVPRFNALDDDEAIRAMVRAIGSAELVTVGEDGYPLATRLPVVWDGDRLVLHIARANPHWRSIPADRDVPALAVVTDAEAYVSPAWYATKAEHGRVVPDLELLRRPDHRPGPPPRGPRVAAGARSRC